jgi:hypothetical protein
LSPLCANVLAYRVFLDAMLVRAAGNGRVRLLIEIGYAAYSMRSSPDGCDAAVDRSYVRELRRSGILDGHLTLVVGVQDCHLAHVVGIFIALA